MTVVINNGGGSTTIVDNSVLDSDNNPDSIVISGPNLQLLFPELNIGSTVHAFSNQSSPDSFAQLALTSTLRVDQPATTFTYTLYTFETGFTFPSGNPKQLRSSYSGTWNGASGSTTTAQGWGDPANVPNQRTVTPGPFTHMATTNFNQSFAFDNGPVNMNDPDNLYSLVFQVAETITGGLPTQGGQLESSGLIRVDATAVPEPATLGMIGFALLGLSSLRRR